MSRIRTIKPELFFDEELASFAPDVRMFFIGMFTQADRRGRMQDRPMMLKAHIYPYEAFDVESALTKLDTPVGPKNKRFITRYSDNVGNKFILINQFEKHQRISGKEAEIESTIPPPDASEMKPGKHPGSTREAPGKHPGAQEGKGRERKGMDIAEASSAQILVPSIQTNGHKPYLIESPLEKVVCGWKVITGYAKDDRGWDKANWKRIARSAKVILEFMGNDYKRAIDCCQEIREKMEKNKLSCTIETVSKHMADWKVQHEHSFT